jgi:hypothetical protein
MRCPYQLPDSALSVHADGYVLLQRMVFTGRTNVLAFISWLVPLEIWIDLQKTQVTSYPYATWKGCLTGGHPCVIVVAPWVSSNVSQDYSMQFVTLISQR